MRTPNHHHHHRPCSPRVCTPPLLAPCWERPYFGESTTSRPICEVKHQQAALVLRSVMTREPAVSYSQKSFFPHQNRARAPAVRRPRVRPPRLRSRAHPRHRARELAEISKAPRGVTNQFFSPPQRPPPSRPPFWPTHTGRTRTRADPPAPQGRHVQARLARGRRHTRTRAATPRSLATHAPTDPWTSQLTLKKLQFLYFIGMRNFPV